MAAANLTEFVTASARAWSKTLSDNVTQHNALLTWLKDSGKIRDVNGGRTIDEAIIYPTNPNTSIKWYSGYDTFNPPTTSEVLDAAEFQWKQLGAFIAISGLEKIQNSGDGKRYDYTRARTEQVEALLANELGAKLYSDGTTASQIGGLKLIVADDPTAAGTVGGIDQVAYSFWRNQFIPAGAALTSTTITAAMNSLWLKCLRGNDQPTLALADNFMYQLYWASLQPQARFTTSKVADAGYTSLKYMGADMVYDYQCPAKHLYLLNMKSLFLKKAPGDLIEVGKSRTIQNADYDVIPFFFAGNLTVNNRSLNGVLISG